VTSSSLLAFSTAIFSGALAAAVPLRKRRSLASWLFFAGMATLAIESFFDGMSLLTPDPDQTAHWQSFAALASSFVPGFWLAFSLTYSRGNYWEFLVKWWLFLAVTFLLPIGTALIWHSDLVQLLRPADFTHGWNLAFGPAGRIVNAVSLIVAILVVNNLEKTFRSTVGTMRWRMKFVFLGLTAILAGRIYTLSQHLLFSTYDFTLLDVANGALFLGCVLITIGNMRDGFEEIEVYPSRSVLQGTLTVLLAGGYLFVIGLFAQFIAFLGGAESFKIQAFLALAAIAVLAILLLSERLRQKIQFFVSRHFKRPQHDCRTVWLRFTHAMSGVLDPDTLCSAAAKSISEAFNILSVTIWRVDQRKEVLVLGGSTVLTSRNATSNTLDTLLRSAMPPPSRLFSSPFNLENEDEQWAENLKRLTMAQFRKGGDRMCLPLVSGERLVGVAVLADRVNALSYTIEELDLLKCIGDQIAACLSNLRLADELMLARELEAFQTMSTFFVHDLKNAASSLSLTLQNLPLHFDHPDFRQEALKGLANTAARINLQISRLGALRRKLDLKPVESDLNQLVTETLANLKAAPGVEVVKDLHPVPKVVVDREQLQNVVTNLLLNAQEAIAGHGRIHVKTGQREGRAIVSVTDDGCGMSPKFLRDSLFRPFQTTKQRGLGIGMFQSKIIVEAHRGSIEVESEPGKGTRFGVTLPLAMADS
jgi:putative PEP-CTERM system histidine kinase